VDGGPLYIHSPVRTHELGPRGVRQPSDGASTARGSAWPAP